jgi:hypothetical protein
MRRYVRERVSRNNDDQVSAMPVGSTWQDIAHTGKLNIDLDLGKKSGKSTVKPTMAQMQQQKQQPAVNGQFTSVVCAPTPPQTCLHHKRAVIKHRIGS